MTHPTPGPLSPPDQALHQRLLCLRQTEWGSTLQIIQRLGEVQRRKLHLRLGHASLFYYCLRELHYCETSALRRLNALRCVQVHPPVMDLLKAGEVTLSTLSLVWRHLTPDNAERVVGLVRGHSKREAEKVLVGEGLIERPARSDRFRVVALPARRVETPLLALDQTAEQGAEAAPVPSAADPGPTRAPAALRSAPGAAGALARPEAPAGGPIRGAEDALPGRPSSPSPQGVRKVERHVVRVEVRGTVSEAVWTDYQKACALLSGSLGPAPSFEQVLGRLANEFLERRDPARRQARRERRQAASAARRARSDAGPEPGRAPGSRHVPDEIRDQVFMRDGFRCTYVGPAGRCEATTGLQLDHSPVPFALGAGHTQGELTVRCRAHNDLEAERVFGEPFMAACRRGGKRVAAAAVEQTPSEGAHASGQ